MTERVDMEFYDPVEFYTKRIEVKWWHLKWLDDFLQSMNPFARTIFVMTVILGAYLLSARFLNPLLWNVIIPFFTGGS